jgi:Domain of unknown function (DUF4389)
VVDAYPVTLEGELDPGLSRWLWLVKWLLLIPHTLLLFLLWLTALFSWPVAVLLILVKGRYPPLLWGFMLGLLQWSWRVGYYGYYGLGTDRYPPFGLEAGSHYPARLDVEYPERLSRGLVLVKWLLALPQVVVAYVAMCLVSVLVLVAGFVLLFNGRYPGGIFHLVLGLDRWIARVGAYVLLMRDEYPPFRLDTGA